MAHIVSLPINGGTPKFLHSDDPAVIARFIEAENRPGYGIYDILNPLVPGAKRHGKENMRGVLFVFVDVDCKDVVEPRAEVERHLRNLALRPTWLNDSGHGFHVIYQLKEEIERSTLEFDRAQAFQEHLIRYLAGDPKVRLWSLLRRPGTTNFKEEPFVQCRTILAGAPVDFTEMEAFCELVAGDPLLTHKVGPDPRDDGQDDGAPKVPVDVEQRLANMRWHGAGNSSIDITRNDVMASLLNSGVCLTEATDIILAAIRACVAGDPAAASWDWRAEYLRTAYNGATLINKDHTLVPLLPDDLRTKFQEMGQGGLEPVIKKNAYKLFVYPTATAARGKKATSDPSNKPGTPAYIHQDNKKVLALRPFVPIDEASLPTRAWLYGKHYQRGTVSLTAGPGGMGKSSLDMVEAVAMATGLNLLGEQPEEMLRVWYHNGDDPQDELDRRLVAICKHYRIPQSELSNRLWTTSAQEFPLKVAKGYANLEIDGNLVRQISEVIAANRIDVAIFDPLVSLHSVSEMDTGKMDAVIRLFAGIGGENNASIDLAHHVRKLPPGAAVDYEVQDIRGVTAITDAVRAARVLNRMSEKDAESAGCDEVARLARFRVDRAKGNYSPAQAATWCQFINIELLNGDDVGVVAHWDFPGQGASTPERDAANHHAEQVFLQLLDKFLDRGVNVSANPGPTYAPSRFADEKEAKAAPRTSKAALKAAMTRLLDSGRVVSEPARGDGRSHRLVRGGDQSEPRIPDVLV